MTYAHQNFLVEAEKVEDGYVLKDHRGYSFKVTDSYFETQYIPVQKIDKEAMARGYEEMADINLEEANVGVHTYSDGLFGDKPC